GSFLGRWCRRTHRAPIPDSSSRKRSLARGGRPCLAGRAEMVVETRGTPFELEARARAAVADSVRILARTRAPGGARQVLHDETQMLTRCAWCNRYDLGGVWTPPGESPRFLHAEGLRARTTHGICQDCFDGLEARRLSR